MWTLVPQHTLQCAIGHGPLQQHYRSCVLLAGRTEVTGALKASFVGANMVNLSAVLLRAGPSPLACTAHIGLGHGGCHASNAADSVRATWYMHHSVQLRPSSTVHTAHLEQIHPHGEGGVIFQDSQHRAAAIGSCAQGCSRGRGRGLCGGHRCSHRGSLCSQGTRSFPWGQCLAGGRSCGHGCCWARSWSCSWGIPKGELKDCGDGAVGCGRDGAPAAPQPSSAV